MVEEGSREEDAQHAFQWSHCGKSGQHLTYVPPPNGYWQASPLFAGSTDPIRRWQTAAFSFYINADYAYCPFLQQLLPLQSHFITPSYNMPSTVTQIVSNMFLSCIRGHREISSDSTSYKQSHYDSNKKGVQIIDKAEMLDIEDCAWM
ncbi:hypothetical protein M422DRAFT_250306 [Sphaerobolus stellatus SS14]|uniref:Uncharacterized protein n=1 Tax=Sphaerobolus stellatus (strain SS14) TaxID=990650 RepID=A0A0C9VGU9_SPHS4|nr:hypothetical protein M422DRAFT_250306 [Sphaerobolus stellatus SS14]